VKRVEQYTQTYPDQKLLMHTPGLVPRFLEDEGRTVDAIQKLFVMINEKRSQVSYCLLVNMMLDSSFFVYEYCANYQQKSMELIFDGLCSVWTSTQSFDGSAIDSG